VGFVPEHFRTAEVCIEAVKQYGDAFEHVPDAFKEEVKKEVVKMIANIKGGYLC
jgi:hypothetical protein